MKVNPDVLISDLKNYLASLNLSITVEALEVLTEYEVRCYKHDVSPYYWDLLYPLILHTSEIQSLINKLGGNTEEALKYLENHITEGIGIIDRYEELPEFYSCKQLSDSRGRLIEICIDKLKNNCRDTISNLDLFESLLQLHEEVNPVINNGIWTDERLKTPFNTLSHIVSSYNESLWVKIDDLKKELQGVYDMAVSYA